MIKNTLAAKNTNNYTLVSTCIIYLYQFLYIIFGKCSIHTEKISWIQHHSFHLEINIYFYTVSQKISPTFLAITRESTVGLS